MANNRLILRNKNTGVVFLLGKAFLSGWYMPPTYKSESEFAENLFEFLSDDSAGLGGDASDIEVVTENELPNGLGSVGPFFPRHERR